MSMVPPVDVPLDSDIPCYQCHYNLRTRLPSQNCPECNAPIADSIEQHGRWSELLYHPRRAANALLLFAISGAAEVIVSVTSAAAPDLFRSPVVYVVSGAIWFAALMGSCVSVIFFVLAMRANVAEGPGARWRITVVVLRLVRTVFSVMAWGLNGYVYYLYYTHTLDMTHAGAYGASIGMHAPSMMVGVAIECIALPYFLRLCRQSGSRRLFAATIALFVAQMISAAVLLIDDFIRTFFIWTDGEFLPGVTWRYLLSWHHFFTPPGLAVDVFLSIYVFILSRRLSRLPGV